MSRKSRLQHNHEHGNSKSELNKAEDEDEDEDEDEWKEEGKKERLREEEGISGLLLLDKICSTQSQVALDEINYKLQTGARLDESSLRVTHLLGELLKRHN